MVVSVLLLLASFALIIGGAVLFTNAVEWLGQRLGLAHGPVGSILAAVATALPESTIPVVSLIGGSGDRPGVALGAIVGAPFLLGTLGMLMLGVSAKAFSGRRVAGSTISASPTSRRDLAVFIPCLAVGLALGLGAPRFLQIAGAVLLVASYVGYVAFTLRSGRQSYSDAGLDPLHFDRTKQDPPAFRELGAQLGLSLILIIGGAELFVTEVEHIAEAVAVEPLILALVLAPLATELPEKANSVVWMRQGKDTLAVSNITGAMVFQSTLPVSLGLVFTSWQFGSLLVVTASLALAGGLLALWRLRRRSFGPLAMLAWAALYVAFVAVVVVTG
jgi:cation:H+ antiporter